MFEVRNIAFSYRAQPVLRDVSFVVSPGETVSLVGDNGVGKTTLLKILATLMMPDSGSIRVDGHDALSQPLRYRAQLGYLPEHSALYEEMTVRAYLTYRAKLKGEPVKRIRRRVEESMAICHISSIQSKVIRTLSLGLKKRVALADAILLRPRVILLDDVLAGLDLTMREAAGEIISSVAAFSSVIVTGHEIADMIKWTTQVLVLRDGVIASTISAVGADKATLIDRVNTALRGGGQ